MHEYRRLLPSLQNLGIDFRHPCPYVHQQNGKVEHKHRSIVDIGPTLLARASMHLKSWCEAFQSTVYLLNQLLTPILDKNSPFGKLFNYSPDYTFLRIFGLACYPNLHPYNSHKFQFRTSKCVFLGYSPRHKGYHCLHSSSDIYISCTIVFNETQFPYTALFEQCSSFVSSGISLVPHFPIPIVSVSSQNHISIRVVYQSPDPLLIFPLISPLLQQLRTSQLFQSHLFPQQCLLFLLFPH